MTIYDASRREISQYQENQASSVALLKGASTMISVAITCALIAASLIPVIYGNSYWWLQFPAFGVMLINALWIQPKLALAIEEREGPFKAHKKLIELEHNDLSWPTKGDFPLVDPRLKSERLDLDVRKTKYPQGARQLKRVTDVYDLAVRGAVVKVHAAARMAHKTEGALNLKDLKNQLVQAQNEFLNAIEKAYRLFRGQLPLEQRLERAEKQLQIYKSYQTKELSEYVTPFLAEVEKGYQGALTAEQKLQRALRLIKIYQDCQLPNNAQAKQDKEERLRANKERWPDGSQEQALGIRGIQTMYARLLPLSSIVERDEKLLKVDESYEGVLADDQKKVRDQLIQGALNKFEKQLNALKQTGVYASSQLMESHYGPFKSINDKIKLLEERCEKECQLREKELVKEAYAKSLSWEQIGKIIDKQTQEIKAKYQALIDSLKVELSLLEIKEIENALLEYAENFKSMKDDIAQLYGRGVAIYGPLKNFSLPPNRALFEKQLQELQVSQIERESYVEKLKNGNYRAKIEFQRLKETEFKKACEGWLERHPQTRLNGIKAQLDQINVYKKTNGDEVKHQANLIKWQELSKDLEQLYQEPEESVYRALETEVIKLQKEVNVHYLQVAKGMASNIFSHFWQKKVQKMPEKPNMPFAMDLAYFKELDSAYFSQLQSGTKKPLGYDAFCKQRATFLEQVKSVDYPSFDARRRALLATLRQDPTISIHVFATNRIKLDELKKQKPDLHKQVVDLWRLENAFLTQLQFGFPDFEKRKNLLKQLGASSFATIGDFAASGGLEELAKAKPNLYNQVLVLLKQEDDFLKLLTVNDHKAFAESRKALLERLGEDTNQSVFEFASNNKESLELIKEQNPDLYDQLAHLMRQEAAFERLHQKLLQLIDSEKFFMLASTMPSNFPEKDLFALNEEWSKINEITDPLVYRKQVLAFSKKIGINHQDLPVVPTQFREKMDEVFDDWQVLKEHFDGNKVISLCKRLNIDLSQELSLFLAKQKQWSAIQNEINLDGYDEKVHQFLDEFNESEALKAEWSEICRISDTNEYKAKVAAFNRKMQVDQAILEEAQELLYRGQIGDSASQVISEFLADALGTQTAVKQVLTQEERVFDFFIKLQTIPQTLHKEMERLNHEWEAVKKTASGYATKAQGLANKLKIKENVSIVSEQRQTMADAQGKLKKIDGSLATIAKINRGLLRYVVAVAFLIVGCVISNPWVGFGMVCGDIVLVVAGYLLEKHAAKLEKNKTALKIEEYVTRHKNRAHVKEFASFTSYQLDKLPKLFARWEKLQKNFAQARDPDKAWVIAQWKQIFSICKALNINPFNEARLELEEIVANETDGELLKEANANLKNVPIEFFMNNMKLPQFLIKEMDGLLENWQLMHSATTQDKHEEGAKAIVQRLGLEMPKNKKLADFKKDAEEIGQRMQRPVLVSTN